MLIFTHFLLHDIQRYQLASDYFYKRTPLDLHYKNEQVTIKNLPDQVKII